MAEKAVSFQIKKLAAIRAIAMMFMCVALFFTACSFFGEDEDPDDNGSVDGGNNNGNNNGGSQSNKVSGLTAVGSSSSSITVSWKPVANAPGYEIYISETSSDPYTRIGGTWSNILSYESRGLADATTYYYKVKTDNGSLSEPVSATTLLKAPSGVKAESLTSSSITITWNNFANATGYRIYKSERSSSYDTYTEIGTSTTNTYTDTGLPFNTTYFYKVSARNDALEGDQSSYVNTTVLLHAPVNVTAVGSSSSSIIISWDAVMGANSYNVYISESSSGLYTKLGNTNSLSYTSSKLATATTYYYKVEALTGSYGSGTGGQLSEPVPGTTN